MEPVEAQGQGSMVHQMAQIKSLIKNSSQIQPRPPIPNDDQYVSSASAMLVPSDQLPMAPATDMIPKQ